MQLTIHRGTKEIGGSCVEISTASTRIIIDVGLPLVDQDREPFDRAVMKDKSLDQLVEAKVVPRMSLDCLPMATQGQTQFCFRTLT